MKLLLTFLSFYCFANSDISMMALVFLEFSMLLYNFLDSFSFIICSLFFIKQSLSSVSFSLFMAFTTEKGHSGSSRYYGFSSSITLLLYLSAYIIYYQIKLYNLNQCSSNNQQFNVSDDEFWFLIFVNKIVYYYFLLFLILFKMGNRTTIVAQEQNDGHRNFNLNEPVPDYGTNKIKSTSYTFLTFIPLNLWNQLQNLANVYFILISILQAIPAVSVTDGKPTTLLPLSFVLLTVLVKDAYEQFIRYLKDQQENNQSSEILTNNGFVQTKWQDLRTGDVIKIRQDQVIPCDCMVLKTNLQGNKCFMETKNLDGQTNLKLRQPVESKFKLDKLTNRQLYNKRYQIQIQKPNPFLHDIKGFMFVEREKVHISSQNALLRGCYLRNCAEAICVCLYVGSDTKVILNSAKFSAKKSKLMAEIDKMVISIFLWQIVISLVVSLFNTLFENSYSQFMGQMGMSKFWLLVPSWWLLMTYFVPISLIVTMEMIKLFQGAVLARDIKGYSYEYQVFTSANNTSVNENLGQIKYVFTDKTGTLTKNEMNFKKIIIDGHAYGNIENIPEETMKKKYPKVQQVSFRDSSFLDNLKDERIECALRILYLCHDIFVDKKSGGQVEYSSSSPDEIALANFGKLCGKQLIGEEGSTIRVFDHSTKSTLKFKKLALLYFSSDRKRMSIILRYPNNQIELLMKGADSIVQKLLLPNQKHFARTQKHLDEFSIQGLRTLLLAKRTISEQEFNKWNQIYKRAQNSIQNRQENLSAAYDLIEKDMQLVGGTAVEDKLQDEVPQTIYQMKNAGIKFFILTGDKKQTAVNIGRSCKLIDKGAKIITYPEEYNEEVKHFKGEKVYLINASKQLPQLPSDLFSSQTICYRCTPVQKENVVKYVKEKSPDLTLAIGDGANDVNMITAADVGVGVRGKQGTQACRVSDLAIGQFKFLSLLTLYYGREWYRKNARLVCYNFFKNWYHVSAVIIYGAYSYFSAVVIYDIYSYELFNVFFTSLPIIVYAVFDQQFTYEQSKKYADLYRPGLQNDEFNQNIYYQSIGRGIVYGFVSLILVFMVLQDDVLDSQGRTGYLEQSGAVLFFSIIVIVNLRILIMSNGLTFILCISVYGSILIYWLVYFIQINFLQIQLSQSFHEEWQTANIIFIHIFIIFVLILTEYAYVKYNEFNNMGKRLHMEKTRNFVVSRFT